MDWGCSKTSVSLFRDALFLVLLLDLLDVGVQREAVRGQPTDLSVGGGLSAEGAGLRVEGWGCRVEG